MSSRRNNVLSLKIEKLRKEGELFIVKLQQMHVFRCKSYVHKYISIKSYYIRFRTYLNLLLLSVIVFAFHFVAPGAVSEGIVLSLPARPYPGRISYRLTGMGARKNIPKKQKVKFQKIGMWLSSFYRNSGFLKFFCWKLRFRYKRGENWGSLLFTFVLLNRGVYQ